MADAEEGSFCALAERCKAWEAEFDARIDARRPFLVRADGRAFHTLTRAMGAEKPEDARFGTWMLGTATHLLRAFSPSTVYVQSDEITLLFPATEHPLFSGRVQKIATAVASAASVAFASQCFPSLPPGQLPTFDARVFQCDDEGTVDAFTWRILDARRNAVQGVAQRALPDRGVGRSTGELRALLDMDSVSPGFQHGVLLKKKHVVRPVEERYGGGECLRSVPATRVATRLPDAEELLQPRVQPHDDQYEPL